LSSAATKKLLKKRQSWFDKREVEYETTAKGSRFLDEILQACKARSGK
jgi:predicted transcriptional regulator